MRKLNENIEWGDFDQFENSDKYLPARGEGDNMATQAATALSKLVYKWFNDGDVYDTSYALEGWANDISGSANWLYKYIPETQPILDRIETIETKEEYTELLFDLCKVVDPKIPGLESFDLKGDAYDEDGKFKYCERCCNCGCVMPDGDYCAGMCQDCYEEQYEEDEDEDDEDEEFDESKVINMPRIREARKANNTK